MFFLAFNIIFVLHMPRIGIDAVVLANFDILLYCWQAQVAMATSGRSDSAISIRSLHSESTFSARSAFSLHSPDDEEEQVRGYLFFF